MTRLLNFYANRNVAFKTNPHQIAFFENAIFSLKYYITVNDHFSDLLFLVKESFQKEVLPIKPLQLDTKHDINIKTIERMSFILSFT